MTADTRKKYLWYVVYAVAGLLLLDRVAITPATRGWTAQGERIESLRKKVARGETFLARETITRNSWNSDLRNNLAADNATAENQAYQAMVRWAQDSGVVTNGLNPTWQNHEDGGYETFEVRATITGDQPSLGKYIYDLEVDPLPVNLEECEIVTRDNRGAQLTMTLRFTFARLAAATTATAGTRRAK